MSTFRFTMVSFPPCKINLGLNIIRKREDGYHDLLTCFYPVPWCDVLEIVPAREFTLSISGGYVPGPSADNLCVRAWELLNKEFNIKPVAIYLHKVLPIGAGLGGGSSDGAYTLRTLNDLFELGLPAERLMDYASRLGSDCAFFIQNKPMLGSGRGEVLTDINVSLKGKYIVIVKPEVSISTAEAFAGIRPRPVPTDLRNALEDHPVSEWKELLRNDFEDHLFERFPVLDALQKKLYAFGAVFASMSGSGSAVFGIFDGETDLKSEFEGVQYWSGYLD